MINKKERGYDPAKDFIVAEIGMIPLGEETAIHVRIAAYGAGDPKIAITVENPRFTSTKIPRMTHEVAQDLGDMLERACEFLDKAKYVEEDQVAAP